MKIIEIQPLANGAHRNQEGGLRTVPEGWAVIPDGMEIPETFPFVDIQVEDGVIQSVQVVGGCSGNLQGISSLLRGMPVEEAIRRMEGIRCGMKPTSCPDQIAQALKTAQA